MGLGDAIVVGAALFVFLIQQVWFHWEWYEATTAGLSANETSCRADPLNDGDLVYVHGCDVVAQTHLLTAAGLESFAPFFQFHGSGSQLRWSTQTWERHLVNDTVCNDQPAEDPAGEAFDQAVHCHQVLVERGHWVQSPGHGNASAFASDFLVGVSGEEASAYGLGASLVEQLSEPTSGFLRQPPADTHFPAASADGPPLNASIAYVDGDSLVSYHSTPSGDAQPSYGDVKVSVRLKRAPAQITVVARQARNAAGRAVLQTTTNVGWAEGGDHSLDYMAESNGVSWNDGKWFVFAGCVEVIVVLMFTANMIQGHPCKADWWVFAAGLCMLAFVNGVAWLPFDLPAAECWVGAGVGGGLLVRAVVYAIRWRETRAAAAAKASVRAREPLLAVEPVLAGLGGCDEEAV